MKNTTNTTNTNTTTNTKNDDIKIIGKEFVFVINNDENTELTDTACIAFREWLKTPQNNKKYINKYGIVGGDWQVDIADVTEFIHVATAQDSLSGGMVDVIYIKFQNSLLDRFVYLDNTIVERGSILLPIDNKIEYVPFTFKYTTARKKTPTKKSTTTKTENKTPKTNTKTNSTTTPKTTQKTDTTKTQKTDKTPTKTAGKVNK